MVTTEEIYGWLESVKDPEIPVLSIVDLGVITGITIEDQRVLIEMTPTFTGCPAIGIMTSEIKDTLARNGIKHSEVTVSYRVPWSSDRITPRGRAALKGFGLAPPPSAELFKDLDILEHAPCPRCAGDDTEMKSPFGSTLCRSIWYCHTCRESFEQFKPV